MGLKWDYNMPVAPDARAVMAGLSHNPRMWGCGQRVGRYDGLTRLGGVLPLSGLVRLALRGSLVAGD